jgi:TctA family transporter
MNWSEFAALLTPTVLVPWLLGMVFGIFVGAMPGLTATNCRS